MEGAVLGYNKKHTTEVANLPVLSSINWSGCLAYGYDYNAHCSKTQRSVALKWVSMDTEKILPEGLGFIPAISYC